MEDIIFDLQKSGKLKVQLTKEIDFISSKVVDEDSVMHSKSDNEEFETYDNVDDIVDECFKVIQYTKMI